MTEEERRKIYIMNLNNQILQRRRSSTIAVSTVDGGVVPGGVVVSETYYMRQQAFLLPRRPDLDIDTDAHTELTSYCVSKVYTGCVFETTTQYIILFISDNNVSSTVRNWDQGFRAVKNKNDGLVFEQGWAIDRDGVGEFIARIVSQFGVGTDWFLGQQWPATPVVKSDSDIWLPYSANTTSLATRYSVGRLTTTDQFQTVTRDATKILDGSDGGKDYYQFHHYMPKNGDHTQNIWYMIGPNVGGTPPKTEGRWGIMNLYKSTDGGLTFPTTIAQDIYFGTIIDLAGFALQGPIYYEDGIYKAMATKNKAPDFRATDGSAVQLIYPYIQNDVVEVSYGSDLEAVTTGSPTILRTVFENSKIGDVGYHPASRVIEHGGYKHIVCNAMGWKIEAGLGQTEITLKSLSTRPAGAGEYLHSNGKDIFPDFVGRFYVPDQIDATHLTYGGTDLLPIEHVTGTAGTIVGAPTRRVMRRIFPTVNDYITFPNSNFTDWYNRQYNLWQLVVLPAGSQTGNVGVFEITGVIKFYRDTNSRWQVWIYDDLGSIKKFSTVNSVSSHSNGIFRDNYQRVAILARLNAGGTDIEVKMSCDYTIETPLTTVANPTFTQIAKNGNDLFMGRNSDLATGINNIGPLIWSTGDTNSNWLSYLRHDLI